MSNYQLSINNYQLSEGYKQTEVGVIPEDWEPKSLGEMLQIGSGFSFKSEFFSTAGPIVLTPGNFKLEGGLYFNDRNTKRYSGSFPKSTVFQNGDLLVVMTDLTPDCNLLGKSAFINSEERILHNQRIGKLNILAESLDKHFLYFLLLSPIYLQKIKEQATGSTVRHTSNRSIYSVVLPIPSKIEEQRSIAQTLSNVDALIAALDKLITKQRHLKTATMQQLLTGKKRLPGFGEGKGYKQTEVGVIPEDWKLNAVGEVCDFIVPGRNKPKDFNGDIPWITTPDLEDGRGVSFSKIGLFISRHEAKTVGSRIVPTGSILMSCVGDLGIVALVEREIVINQQLHAFIPSDEIDPIFLLNALQTKKDYMLSMATITAVPYLNKDNCNSIPIAFPRIEEQRAIATVLSDMDAAISALETRRAKTQAIKQGMMQELLTGRTRLV